MGKAGSGYKKPAGKKKAFSKKDIIYTSLVAAAVIILIAVLAIVINNDDFIRTKNGRLQMDDNWLIAQFAKNNGTNYYQIGEVGDIEGFELGSESAGNTLKTFTPYDLTNNVTVVYVGASASNYAQMAAYMSASTALSFGNEAYVPVEMELCGRDALYVYCVNEPSADEETAEEADETAEETTDEATDETVDETTEETTDETAEEYVDETADETVEETSDEAVEETAEETEASDGEVANIIYAFIEYDDERCIFIQFNTMEKITEDEGKAFIETVADAITVIDR